MIQPGIDLAGGTLAANGGTELGNLAPALADSVSAPAAVSSLSPPIEAPAPAVAAAVAVALSQLPAGSEATLSGDLLPAEDRDMLRAMGLTDQAPVRVCRQGEPCIVQVRTTRVGLSRAIAELLRAVPTPVPAPLSTAR